MLMKELISFLKAELSSHLNIPIQSINYAPVGGGSINQTFRLTINNNQHFFCKINSASQFPLLFEKEKSGLVLLAEQKVIQTPHIIMCEVHQDWQILVLEWIEQGLKTTQSWKHFGEQLAQLHSISWIENGQSRFGLTENNYMGALPQLNDPAGDWVAFFIEKRLRPQTKMAFDAGLLSSSHLQQFEQLYRALPNLFPPAPSCLLHGDLWSGNFLIDVQEQPVLIDPAVYYGHNAIDMGMTTLFGGFDPVFYEAYHYHHAPESHYQEQWDICNLYPLLIHLNLFGSGYRHDIEYTLERYHA